LHSTSHSQIFRKQADKLQALISAAKVPEIEPIWTSLFAKALEGKDVKDLLLNVGSGGAAAPAAGGAAAGGAAASADAPAEEKAEEGKSNRIEAKTKTRARSLTISPNREGGVRRRHGLRSLRLSASRLVSASKCLDKARNVLWQAGSRHGIDDDKDDVSWRGEETSSGMSRFRSYSLNACGSLSSGFFDCHEKNSCLMCQTFCTFHVMFSAMLSTVIHLDHWTTRS
jgi:ribosomal protein L12E/L44/L45/RPP1/RPP2